MKGTKKTDPAKDKAERRLKLRHLQGLKDALQAARESFARLEHVGGEAVHLMKAARKCNELAAQVKKLEDEVKPGSGYGRVWHGL